MPKMQSKKRSRAASSAVPKRKKGKKDPNAPKRNWTSFMFFSNAKRAEVKENNPDASFGEIAKIIGAEFKKLDQDEKEEWEEKAREDKERYQREMSEYTPPSDESDEFASARNGKGGKAKKIKDPNAPKKNLTSYMIYSSANRSKIKEKNPDASFGELGKIMGQKFRNLSDKERKKWDDKAKADKQRYQRELKEYEMKKNNEIEDDEVDEDLSEQEAISEELSEEESEEEDDSE